MFRQFGKFRQAMQGIGGEGGIWSANGSRQGGCLMESGGAALRPCWQLARYGFKQIHRYRYSLVNDKYPGYRYTWIQMKISVPRYRY